MKMGVSGTYINTIVDSLGKKKNNYIFVKHYGRYSIDAEDAKNAMNISENLEVSYVHYESNEISDSYQPFLSIIKNCYEKHYSELSVDEYLEMFEIYQLHEFFLKTYVSRGECERYEPFILDEIEFEKKMMLESIANIMLTLSKEHPMLIMIDNVHVLSSSSIRLLKYLFDNPDNTNIGIFATYNDLKHVANINKKEWDSFINAINVKGCVFEGGADGNETDAEAYCEFVFDSKRVNEYLNKLKFMYCTVELEEAEFYLQKIHKKLSNEKIKVDRDCKYELLKLYTEVLINLGDFATALIICDNMKEMCEAYDKLEYKYHYYLLYAYIEMYNRKNEYAKEMVSKCKKVALKMNCEKSIFRAELLRYMIDMSGWHNIYFMANDVEIADDFIEQIKDNKYFNHLASLYIFGYENDFSLYKDAKTVEEVERDMVKYHKGVALAKELGNKNLLAKAYQKLTMMSSANGAFHITQEYYEKYIEFLGDSNPKALADAKNGQGYINCSSRNFKRANECYNTSLGIFMELGDINAIGETLYNMSINCILAQDYSSAFNYLKVCIRIVEKMRLNDLRVCNIAKLYGLLALASVRLSYEYDTSFYINTNKKFLDHIINSCTYKDEENRYKVFTGNDDELFLHYFVRGLLDARNGKNVEALQCYKQAEVHCMKSIGNMFFSFVQLNVAMANIYRALGDEENALLMIDRALAYATEKNYADQIALLEDMRQGAEYNQPMVDCGLKTYTIEQIDELLDKSSMVVKNQDMSNHIEFISVWQNVLEINNKTKENLINTAANSFMLNFNLDTFIYIEYYEDSAKVLFCDGPVTLKGNDVEMLRIYFEKRKTGFVTAKIDKDYDDYGRILDIFGKDVLCSMVCNPYFENEKLDSLFISCIYIKQNWSVESYKYFLNENEANIYNLLLRQLLMAVDKVENLNEIKHMNEALKQSSFTDYLTGLRNRNGLYDSFNKLLKRAERRKESLDLSVLYIDLDNFKYYNDTFGHDVGDLVLKEVSEILNNTASESGFAIRYGGDEFLIILETASKKQAMNKARYMLDTLISKNGYVDEINSFLGKTIELKDEKKISCSIGVATAKNLTSDKDLSDLLKCADSSLYDVKHTTKNAIKFYEN